MELEFEDLGGFYRTPPALEDLVFEAKDQRRGKRELLIIVPSYHDHYRLGKFLACMKRQTFGGFDVAVILAKDDEFVDALGLTLCQVKRNVDAGFAGAVYLGQLLALEGGYKYYLFTDVDRVPHDEGVLQLLYDTAEKKQADFVYGNNILKGYYFDSGGFFEFKNPHVTKSNCVFGLIRTSTLERTGLYALPLYLGYEDVEFEYRLRKAIGAQAYLGRTIYERYCSSAKNAFLKNFRNGRMDNLYGYPTMVCLFNSPQTICHLGFFTKVNMVFLVLLVQKFSALRIPGLSRLEENARRGTLVKTHATGVSDEITTTRAETGIVEDYGNHIAHATVENSARILSAIFSHSVGYKTSSYSPLFDFFIHDTFYVFDEGQKATLLFEWKRKPGLAAKLLAFSSALIDAAAVLLRSQYLDAIGGKSMFDRYGEGRVGETMAKARGKGGQ